jgi:hypothetical protein
MFSTVDRVTEHALERTLIRPFGPPSPATREKDVCVVPAARRQLLVLHCLTQPSRQLLVVIA